MHALAQLVPKSMALARQGKPIHGAAGGSGLALAAALAAEAQCLLYLAPDYDQALAAFEDLSFYLPAPQVGFFPHWDCLPYDNQSPSKAVMAGRIDAALRLANGQLRVLVSTPQALLQRLTPIQLLQEAALELVPGQVLAPAALALRLAGLGYQAVELVEDQGEFCRRGEIFDFFPIDAEQPVRLDYFDDEIETIKTFDVESQVSQASLTGLRVLPASELVPLPQARQLALDQLPDLREGSDKNEYFNLREAIEQGASLSGMEHYLALFAPQAQTLGDYFPQPPLVLLADSDEIKTQLEQAYGQVVQECQYALEQGTPLVPLEKAYQSASQVWTWLKAQRHLELDPLHGEGGASLEAAGNLNLAHLNLNSETQTQSLLYRSLSQLVTWAKAGAKVGLATGSMTRAEHVQGLLGELGLTAAIQASSSPAERLAWVVSPSHPQLPGFVLFPLHLNQGFRLLGPQGETRFALVTEEEVFGPKAKKRRLAASSLKHFLSTLGDLKPGDYVVHVEYGIGTYEGLKKISPQPGQENDFLVIGYKDGDKVYVPVENFNLVQKFQGGEGNRPTLAKLGDKAWSKAKAKVQEEVDDMAEELIALYAAREAQRGVAFGPDGEMMREFALAFAYNETPDQEKAIAEVMGDMESTRPMDRLVCGDVGFGKTEVAMRACLKAVSNDFQAGVLVPTTILAQQHYDTFVERFQGQAVNIGLLSRFVPPKEVKATLEKLKAGKLDILIGTHRLLSQDVAWGKLGLLVIDEEQRFGVKHKEKIKQVKTHVDCLTLSATPIPRTLHMSMIGVRDISVINTPPMDRRAIRTRLMKLNDYVITEAVTRELRRGGQVFFVHNRVEDIQEVAGYLTRLLPKVKIAVAHGQMAEHQLEEIMFGFIHKEHDLLLATTIVESGLDIPNANTILINNADKFGLSQLYQLRGRVGRAKAQAYCYLLTPKEKLLPEVAKKRLNILSELNHLGAGFKLASYDLELRGAGNLLGAKQSGHIAQVGYELYAQMIQEAVAKLKGEEKQSDFSEIKLHWSLPANLPEQWIPSMNQRLDAYKQLAAAKAEDELWQLQNDLEDRFGPPPGEATRLLHAMQARLWAAKLGVKQLVLEAGRLKLLVGEGFTPDPVRMMKWLQGQTASRLLPQGGVELACPGNEPKDAVNLLKALHSALHQEAA